MMKLPLSPGATAVTLTTAALAVEGTPQELTLMIGKLRAVLAASTGPPEGPLALRVSTTRHGVRGKKLYGPPAWPETSAAAKSSDRPATARIATFPEEDRPLVFPGSLTLFM